MELREAKYWLGTWAYYEKLPVMEEEGRKENVKYDLILQHSWTCTDARTCTHSLYGYFWFDSLSALTTDGVLIKSSRNITVSKQSNACQFHNCWVLIQPLTWWIQIGRKPTVHTPTGSSQIRSCGTLQHWASPRKVNCSSNHLSWHWAWGTAAIWLVIKVWSPSFWEIK